MKKLEGKQRIFWAVMVGAFCLGVFWAGILAYVQSSKQIWEKDERTRIMKVLVSLRSTIENELYSRVYYTKSVAAYVSLHPDADEKEFQNLASELIGADPVINTMSIAPDAVISSVYPLVGHEEAIGLDLLDHPDRRRIVEQTIRTGKTYIAGPVELVEGGIAFISYTPIFDKTKSEPWEFWGMTDIVIKKNELFAAAGLGPIERNVQIALRGSDGKGEKGGVFLGDPEVFRNDPVKVSILLPDGEWVLAGYPVGGWAGYLDQDLTILVLMVMSSSIIALLIAFLVAIILKLHESKNRLQELNDDKNRLISIIAHDLRSPISAVQSLSSEMLTSDEFHMDSASEEVVGLIYQSSEESLFLLENLLDWVKSRETGELSEVDSLDLSVLCESVRGSFQAAARNKTVRIANEVPPGSVVFADTRILETVLRNLISNAVKFSPERETVVIGIGKAGPGRLEVYVKDNGVGMSPERVKEVLSMEKGRSFLGTNREKGAGIGMILCRDLLRHSGQTFRIESEVDSGTTVYFSLSTVAPCKE